MLNVSQIIIIVDKWKLYTVAKYIFLFPPYSKCAMNDRFMKPF